MTDTTYNGWTNRETWLVNLWLGEEDFIGNQQDGRTEPVAEFAVKFYLRQWVQNQYAVHAQIPREFGFVQDMAGADPETINYDELAELLAYDINSILEPVQ